MVQTRLLGQAAAVALDVELMSSPGFSIDQLMELAGLSVAVALAAAFPIGSRVLAVAGPGNNGGDALVAARHLVHFGYHPTVLYPKRPKRELFVNLVSQLEQLDVPFAEEFNDKGGDAGQSDYDVVLDGIFGFSFDSSSAVRSPFDTILDRMVASDLPVVSIDIPSGWDVERGDTKGMGFQPHTLVSLTAPKLCSVHFTGQNHYLGGRFLPPKLAEKYDLDLPRYEGVSQILKLDHEEIRAAAAAEGCTAAGL